MLLYYAKTFTKHKVHMRLIGMSFRKYFDLMMAQSILKKKYDWDI